MYCKECGSQIPDDSRFCGNCGAIVSQAAGAPAGGGEAPESGGGTTGDGRAGGRGAGSPGTLQGAQYIPPGGLHQQPPTRPDRTVMWIAIGAAAVIILTLAIALPLILTGRGEDEVVSSTTSSVTTTTVETTTTTLPETTTSSSAPPTTAASTTTAPPTTAASTTTTGIPGDSAGEWVEIEVPGGPWEANAVAVSEDALLLQTPTATGARLHAVMFGSGDVIELAEADALWDFDIDGAVAVWWEGNGWSDAAQKYTDQHIYTYQLPDGPRTEIVGGGNMTAAQIAMPWVTWAEGEPWADNPDEYQAFRIIAQRVDETGAKVGTPREYVSQALAFMLGDSGWGYSVSDLYLAWENALDTGAYAAGTHILELELEDHGLIGADAWRPSLWEDILVYSETGLRYQVVSAGGSHLLDPEGEFATAGPTFAAYYRLSGSGSDIVAKGYNGTHEQVLGTNPDPPWWCPPIAVSQTHIAFTIGTEVHLLKWGG